jgi:hypothetical protein
MFANVLIRLDEAAMARVALHNERGTITLGGSIREMVEHVDHHLRFLYEKRKLLGR